MKKPVRILGIVKVRYMTSYYSCLSVFFSIFLVLIHFLFFCQQYAAEELCLSIHLSVRCLSINTYIYGGISEKLAMNDVVFSMELQN